MYTSPAHPTARGFEARSDRIDRRQTTLFAITLFVAAWAYACGDGTVEPPPPDPPRPTTVTVNPATALLVSLDATVQLSAEVRDQNGNAMTGTAVTWSSSDATVATVDPSGLVTAASGGSAVVTATAGAASGTAAVAVDQTPAEVAVDPATHTLVALGDTIRLSAEALDANGNVVAAAQLAWSSSDTSVATVNSSGLVTAMANGTTTVTAVAGEVRGTAEITVEHPAGAALVATLVRPASLAPAEAGKQGRDTIVVAVTDGLGSPAAGARYQWTTDRHSGWVYPPRGTTSANGLITATWVAGWPGRGELALSVAKGDATQEIRIATRSTGSANNPSGAAYFWVYSPTATGYSVDLTPLAEPEGTYYAAIQWDGGYTGLQRAGSRYDRQLQFSVWDAPGVGGAEIIEVGEGTICTSFGGEGTGRKCELEYPWTVGSTYRFEMTEAGRDGGSAITVHVTDLAAGTRRFVATLRFARRSNLTSFGMFVEDFWMRGEHCLAQEVRSAAIRRARARVNGTWQALTEAVFSRHSKDYMNPSTPACANQAARPHAAGLELVIGGRTSSDPNGPTRFKIPN